MTHEEALALYRELFTAWPKYRHYWQGAEDTAATMRLWCGIIEGCRYDDGWLAVQDMLTKPAPTFDAIPARIREYCHDRITKRMESKRSRLIREATHGPKSVGMKRYPETVRRVMNSGRLVRDGKRSKAEHADYVDCMADWMEGRGELPELLQGGGE